jgi:signal transduction histidine kinase
MKKFSNILSLFAGFLILLLSVYGFFLLQQRAGLPAEIKGASDEGRLIQVDDTKIEKKVDLEFVLSRRSADETATFYVRTDTGINQIQGRLIAYYSQYPFPILYLIIGSFCFIMAFVVFILRPQELRARLFYWSALAFSFASIVNGGFFCLQDEWLSYLPGILFYIFYPFCLAFLLHFSLTFFRLRTKSFVFLFYIPALLIALIWDFLFLKASLTSSVQAFRQYQSVVFINRFYVIVYVLISFFVLILSHKKSVLEEQKAQIKWILYGLIFGVGPFILLYQLPKALIQKTFITEELAGVFFIFVPVAFAFSIIRFKLMNIELIINRSLVYAILTIFTASIYLLSVQVIQTLFSKSLGIQHGVVTVIAVLAAAAAFHPARKKIQDFVDRSFFRMSYDYQKSLLSFNERAHRMAHTRHLVDFFLIKMNKTMPLEYIGVIVHSSKANKPEVFLQSGGKKDLDELKSNFSGKARIYGRRKSVQTELGIDFSAEDWMKDAELDLIIPMPFRSMELAGFLALGKKKSGARYSRDDIELLLTMSETLALNLERIRLLEEVVYERAEKQKFDELNRLKTEFISSVSHEIRTPMSSIQGMSEILQLGKIKEKEKQEELLNLMTDECSRLSRFLHNILDYGKIEQRAKSYTFQKTDVRSIVEKVLKMFDYQLRSRGFLVQKDIPQRPVLLDIDADSIHQALTNLIDNAIKYSDPEREISVSIIEKSQEVDIRVSDKGIGIPEEEREKIFNAFYRMSAPKEKEKKGVGLGLNIVKHIMEAHGGDVHVHSKKGEGSTFVLVFPRS